MDAVGCCEQEHHFPYAHHLVRVRDRVRDRVRVRVAPGHGEADVAEPLRLALGRGVDVVDVDEDIWALARVAWQSGTCLG